MYDLPSEEVGEPGLPDQQSDWTWRMRFAVPRSQYHPIQAELLPELDSNFNGTGRTGTTESRAFSSLAHRKWHQPR